MMEVVMTEPVQTEPVEPVVQSDVIDNQVLADTINALGYPEITAAQIAEIRWRYREDMKGQDLPLDQEAQVNAVVAMRAMVRSHTEDFDD